MEIMNKKYLIKTKNSKIIIFMRGGILVLVQTRAKNEKIFKFKIQKIVFYKFYADGWY